MTPSTCRLDEPFRLAAILGDPHDPLQLREHDPARVPGHAERTGRRTDGHRRASGDGYLLERPIGSRPERDGLTIRREGGVRHELVLRRLPCPGWAAPRAPTANAGRCESWSRRPSSCRREKWRPPGGWRSSAAGPPPSTNGNRVTAGVSVVDGLKYSVATLESAPTTIAVPTTGMARFHSGCGGATICAIAGAARGAAAIASISTRKSPTACHRFFGFFSRHRRRSSGHPRVQIRRQQVQVGLACRGPRRARRERCRP